jgi:hypothetical protein
VCVIGFVWGIDCVAGVQGMYGVHGVCMEYMACIGGIGVYGC